MNRRQRASLVPNRHRVVLRPSNLCFYMESSRLNLTKPPVGIFHRQRGPRGPLQMEFLDFLDWRDQQSDPVLGRG